MTHRHDFPLDPDPLTVPEPPYSPPEPEDSGMIVLYVGVALLVAAVVLVLVATR